MLFFCCKFACLSPYGNFLLTCFPVPRRIVRAVNPIKNHLTCCNKFKRNREGAVEPMKNRRKEHPYCSRYHSHRDSDIIDGRVMQISLEGNFFFDFGKCSKKKEEFHTHHTGKCQGTRLPHHLRDSMRI